MMKLVRWILILPAAVAAWYASLFVGMVLYQGVELLCPADQVVSGHCEAPWFFKVTQGIIAFGAAFAAALIMTISVSVAPTHKREVSIATYAVGSVVAIAMGLTASAYVPMVAAVVVGAIALLVLLRRFNVARCAANGEQS